MDGEIKIEEIKECARIHKLFHHPFKANQRLLSSVRERWTTDTHNGLTFQKRRFLSCAIFGGSSIKLRAQVGSSSHGLISGDAVFFVCPSRNERGHAHSSVQLIKERTPFRNVSGDSTLFFATADARASLKWLFAEKNKGESLKTLWVLPTARGLSSNKSSDEQLRADCRTAAMDFTMEQPSRA